MSFPRPLSLSLLALSLVLSVSGVGFSGATLSQASTNPSNRFVAASDWVAPSISGAAVSSTNPSGSPVAVPGFLRQGATYRAYANISDANSGVASARADLSGLSGAAAASVALAAGSYSVAGATYNYATAQQTASATLSEGSKPLSVSATDAAGNSASSSATATVDNTPPTATDIQTSNAAGGTNGHPEQGDQVVYTFSEPIDPGSILSGWTGASTSVVLRFTNGSPNDSFGIWNAANTAQLPLGSIDAGKKYVTQNITYGATGTPSTMVMSGSTITVTLGTQSANASTANGTVTMKWTPSALATDRAGNALTATVLSEGGTADLDF